MYSDKEAGIAADKHREETPIWQWRKRGTSEWTTPEMEDNPSNPAYRKRWASEYEFRSVSQKREEEMIVSEPYKPTNPAKPKNRAQKMADMLSGLEVDMAVKVTLEKHEFGPNVRGHVNAAQREFSPKRKFSTRTVSDTEFEVIRTL